MRYVLSLIGKALTTDQVAGAQAALMSPEDPVWLSSGEAVEIEFSGAAPRAAEDAVRRTLSHAAIDVVVQPAQGRRRKLLLADMDSTIITVECIDEMADMLGLRRDVAAITGRAMAGEIDFAEALSRRVGMLAGLPLAKLDEVYRERVRLTPGARELAMTMRAHGALTALISGGFKYFTERVAEAAGFQLDFANRLGVDGDRLDGTVRAPVLDASIKLKTLQRLTAERGLQPQDTLAVGDGANDLPMIRAAGLGVAFRGKPAVAAAAPARIEHGDLTALLYLQGYRRTEFVR